MERWSTYARTASNAWITFYPSTEVVQSCWPEMALWSSSLAPLMPLGAAIEFQQAMAEPGRSVGGNYIPNKAFRTGSADPRPAR